MKYTQIMLRSDGTLTINGIPSEFANGDELDKVMDTLLIEKNILQITQPTDITAYCSIDENGKAIFREEAKEEVDLWDIAYKEANHYLTTEHPTGKIIGYNHSQLIKYLKEHFKIERSKTNN